MAPQSKVQAKSEGFFDNLTKQLEAEMKTRVDGEIQHLRTTLTKRTTETEQRASALETQLVNERRRYEGFDIEYSKKHSLTLRQEQQITKLGRQLGENALLLEENTRQLGEMQQQLDKTKEQLKESEQEYKTKEQQLIEKEQQYNVLRDKIRRVTRDVSSERTQEAMGRESDWPAKRPRPGPNSLADIAALIDPATGGFRRTSQKDAKR